MDRERFEKAVRTYWEVRMQQKQRQEKKGAKDVGTRSEVTGGKHMDAMADVLVEAFVEAGFSSKGIHKAKKVELPGYFRHSKNWDLVVIHEDQLRRRDQVGVPGRFVRQKCQQPL